MKRGIGMALAAWAALAATGAHAAAGAQDKPCLTSAETQALFTAVSPAALTAVTTACSPALPANAYLRTRGDALVQRYRVAAMQARPLATAALGKVSGVGKFVTPEMLDAFAGPMIGAMVSKDIKPDTCANIDRIAGLLDPLPPSNFAGLVATIYELTTRNSQKAPPFEICRS
jgi:hypothetical protein